MFILPQFQNKGLGQQVVLQTETLYPQATSWELDTLLQEEANLHFYKKLGYKQLDEIKFINDKLSLVTFSK